ncbi:unnamed protein product [Menidia menidia]|uniref:(Atlantic silverside) hypothetical protein n=1 Tax=Menidia menidia TaxID=238744 RepID=A0A8S4BCI3_9TELE|nr:unnamed protein product [Menidia menidia]
MAIHIEVPGNFGQGELNAVHLRSENDLAPQSGVLLKHGRHVQHVILPGKRDIGALTFQFNAMFVSQIKDVITHSGLNWDPLTSPLTSLYRGHVLQSGILRESLKVSPMLDRTAADAAMTLFWSRARKQPIGEKSEIKWRCYLNLEKKNARLDNCREINVDKKSDAGKQEETIPCSYFGFYLDRLLKRRMIKKKWQREVKGLVGHGGVTNRVNKPKQTEEAPPIVDTFFMFLSYSDVVAGLIWGPYHWSGTENCLVIDCRGRVSVSGTCNQDELKSTVFWRK